MQCPCGGETLESTHAVITIKKAQEWYGKTTEKDLPVRIEQDKCKGCGRAHVKVRAESGKLLTWRG